MYDALRDARSYKVALDPLEALRRMRDGDSRLASGGFNPEILKILEENWEEVEQLWSRATPIPEPGEAQAVFAFEGTRQEGKMT